MSEILYSEENSLYKEKNPDWHVEDSPWKATQVVNMMGRNELRPKSIVEIGCGAGEILCQLHQRLPDKSIHFSGYEISPDAYKLCKERVKDRIEFYHEDLLRKEKTFDLLLMMDVFEHVEDYFGFLRKAKDKATYKIYHIPLDISHLNLMIDRLNKQRKSVGHIHYFTKDTALASISDTGQEIIDWFYTKYSLELFTQNLSLASRIINSLRRISYSYKPDLAANLFGGYSLLVLAK